MPPMWRSDGYFYGFDRRTRLYHSWDYEEADISTAFEEKPAPEKKQEDFGLF